MPLALLYKAALLVVIVASGASTSGLVYYFQNRTSTLDSQVASLNSQKDAEHGRVAALEDQVANLTSQVANLKSQVSDLTSANSALLTEIVQLEKQLAANGALCSSGKTFVLGELTDLTNALSDTGTRVKDSSKIAVDDVNSFLSTTGCNLKFSLVVDDYRLDNAMALSELQSLSAQGAQVVVGPLTSGSAQFLLTYANANHIVLISPSSSSPLLGIQNDYLFRSSPPDSAQALADARMMIDRGAQAAIIIERNDAYGNGVAAATSTRFTQLGGTVIDTIQYDAPTTDFTSAINLLYADYTNNAARYAGHIALDFISFEEFGALIIQANRLHPSLLSGPMPWFGTDGEAQDFILTGNATSGPLLAQVKLPSTLYFAPNNTKTIAFNTVFAAHYPGQTCDVYCGTAYDDVWLAALATLQVGAYDGAKIQSAMLTVASNYYGVTGWNGLDANGDRIAQSYQIWKVVSQGTGYVWVLAGTWDATTDKIIWNSPP